MSIDINSKYDDLDVQTDLYAIYYYKNGLFAVPAARIGDYTVIFTSKKEIKAQKHPCVAFMHRQNVELASIKVDDDGIELLEISMSETTHSSFIIALSNLLEAPDYIFQSDFNVDAQRETIRDFVKTMCKVCTESNVKPYQFLSVIYSYIANILEYGGVAHLIPGIASDINQAVSEYFGDGDVDDDEPEDDGAEPEDDGGISGFLSGLNF